MTNRQIDRPSVRPTKQPTERQTDRPIGAWKSYFQTFKKIVTDRRTNRIEYSKSRYIPLPALLTQAEAETCFRSVVFFLSMPMTLHVSLPIGWLVCWPVCHNFKFYFPCSNRSTCFLAHDQLSANVLTRKMYLNEFTRR